MPKMIIAVDGPSSSGKGTIAKMLAKHFGLPYLNTGALYRKLAYDSVNAGLNLEMDEVNIIKLIDNMDLSDLESKEIHNENVGRSASIIAKNNNIRESLRNLQQDFANQESGSVLDGRDIGTVISPNADHKFFITASLEERTNRRFLQLSKIDPETKKEDIFNQLQERDLRDKNRDSAPLTKADDAIEIDTSDLNIDQVFDKILQHISS